MNLRGEFVFAHDFRNWKLRRHKKRFINFAPSVVGFAFCFVVLGVRLSVWGTKAFRIGEKNMTSVNLPILDLQ